MGTMANLAPMAYGGTQGPEPATDRKALRSSQRGPPGDAVLPPDHRRPAAGRRPRGADLQSFKALTDRTNASEWMWGHPRPGVRAGAQAAWIRQRQT
jgi:hypothetical protein